MLQSPHARFVMLMRRVLGYLIVMGLMAGTAWLFAFWGKCTEAERVESMAITAQQERFIQEYIKCRKGAEAARRAGYAPDSARVTASKLLTNANILKEIQERTKANAMELDESLSRLADFARADLGEWISDDGEIDIAAMKRDGATHMIRKVKRTRRSGVSVSGAEWEEITAEVELHDAKDANKFIADLHSRGPSGKENDPLHIKVIEGPKDVR